MPSGRGRSQDDVWRHYRNCGAPQAPFNGVRKIGVPQGEVAFTCDLALCRAVTILRAATIAATSSGVGFPLI